MPRHSHREDPFFDDVRVPDDRSEYINPRVFNHDDVGMPPRYRHSRVESPPATRAAKHYVPQAPPDDPYMSRSQRSTPDAYRPRRTARFSSPSPPPRRQHSPPPRGQHSRDQDQDRDRDWDRDRGRRHHDDPEPEDAIPRPTGATAATMTRPSTSQPPR